MGWQNLENLIVLHRERERDGVIMRGLKMHVAIPGKPPRCRKWTADKIAKRK